eukprot:5700606-Pleurochrysis_carterae.AAC.5
MPQEHENRVDMLTLCGEESFPPQDGNRRAQISATAGIRTLQVLHLCHHIALSGLCPCAV